IPLADQVVQVGHACLEAGGKFGSPPPASGPCHLVLLGVPTERHLREALARLEALGVRYVFFFEPDEGMGYTAACTEPVESAQRRFFRRFPLWQPAQRVVEVTATPADPSVRGPPRGLFSPTLTSGLTDTYA